MSQTRTFRLGECVRVQIWKSKFSGDIIIQNSSYWRWETIWEGKIKESTLYSYNWFNWNHFWNEVIWMADIINLLKKNSDGNSIHQMYWLIHICWFNQKHVLIPTIVCFHCISKEKGKSRKILWFWELTLSFTPILAILDMY